MASPLLPWEVIERVIGHSGGHPQTLHNFSLTCRGLRPRALCLLVADVRFEDRDQIFDFCDFLQVNPHLKPLVRSIAVNPNDFAPFPLLHILPSLFTLKFTPIQVEFNDDDDETPASTIVTVTVNWSIFACCKHLGTHVQALHLSKLSFPTYLDFARVLLTFTYLTDLVCSGVVIGTKGNQAHLDVLKPRLSKRLHLRTIGIDYDALEKEGFYDKPSVAALLLDSGLVQSTVDTLTVQLPYRSYQLSHGFDWPRLQSLVLKLRFVPREIADTIVFLKDFSPSTPKDVVVELHSDIAGDITYVDETISRLFKELEQTLLRFPRPRIVWLPNELRKGSISFWTQEVGKHFPVLSKRGAFTAVTPRTVVPRTGHDGMVLDLATSPDGKCQWVATASDDSTVILWDTTGGAIVQRWIPHNYRVVNSLAFSPVSRCLASGGEDSKVKIWDLAEGLREVSTLEGHTTRVNCCAWSPHGDIIASGSDDSTVRLWDARALHALYVLEPPDGDNILLVAFSPDGCWLVSGSFSGYQIWNVASGTVHKSFLPGTVPPHAAFDPGSTRLLMAHRGVVKLVDIESGEEQVVLKGLHGTNVVAFSPDGTLVLTSSDDGALKLWDAYTGNQLSSLEGHRMPVCQACFSPCGKYVTSASDDGTMRLWRTRDGSCVETLSEYKGEEMYRVAFSPDGETLWSGDEHGTVIMWRMRDIIPTDEQVHTLC